MDDLVAYKVYTFWTEGAKPEVRRFGIEKSVVTSFQYLNAKLQDVFPGLRGRHYIVTWKDEEEDDITISSDEEVIAALAAITPSSNIIKLFVYVKDDKKDDDVEVVISAVADGLNAAAGPNNSVHYGVTCDACDSEVVGFRYKCISCDDYDLCAACESNGLHREHCMLRVPMPSLPRAVIKAAIKRSRHFLKSVVGPVGEECAYKRHRRERSGERKQRGSGDHGAYAGHGSHSGHGGHGGDRDHPHREHHRRNRGSWLETFATYMNEFANLAGDIDLTGEAKKDQAQSSKTSTSTAEAAPKSQEGTAQAGQENAQNSAPTNQEPNQSTPTACPFFPGNVNVENIQKLIDMYVSGRLNLNEFLREQATATTATNTNAEAAAPNVDAATTTANDVEMGQAAQKVAEPDAVSTASSEARAAIVDEGRDASPDKIDGWTMISNEKDMEEACAAPAPIGFNLPEEFQDRVQISGRPNLYPPLNTATAEPEVYKQQTAPSAPPAQTPPAQAPPAQAPPAQAPPAQAPQAQAQPPRPQPQPQPQPRQRHPKAHIDAAIQQMLAMGFTNEGGWLTNVLESKDGNISAVLDLLTPVQRK